MKQSTKWKKLVDKAELEWRRDKEKAMQPFNAVGYLKATSKYINTMNKATYEALREEL